MSFNVNQSLSVNQQRNARLNEYFAVVGLPDGPLLVSDTHSGSTAQPATAVFSASWKVRSRADPAAGSFSSSSSDDDEETTEDEGHLDSPPPSVAGGVRLPLQRNYTYGSCALGTVRAKGARGVGGAGDGGEEDSPLIARYRTRVLHRFPAYDHEGSVFPTNLSLFCLPGGLKLSLEMKLPTFFTFVHTRANGQHMFGYCLCLYEAIGDGHRKELQDLVDAHQAAGGSRRGRRIKKRSARDSGAAPPQGDLPSSVLGASQEVYAPRCLCLLSTWPYFGPFREWFLNLYRISLSPSKIPLERYIGNFLLEVPTPSPGRMEVLYNMGNSTIAFVCPPPNKPVAWGSVPFEPLFQCLSHGNIVAVFSCLLLERSVLLKSSQLSLLTPCAEVLTLLLYPLCWAHVYIPVLPEALLGVLAAPMPFLMGVHRSFLEDNGMDLPPHLVQVDLDNDIVNMGKYAPPPSLPPKRQSKLLAKLAQHADLEHCRTPEFREEVMRKSDLAFPMAVRPCDYDEADESDREPPDWDAVREAFLRFFVALLAGYRRFLVYPTKQDPNPRRSFSVEEYLDKLERDSRPFAESMCDTQAFQNFVDARIQPEEGDLDIVFFDACICAKKNRSMRSVIKKDTNFLRPGMYVKAKTVYALTPDTTGLDMTAPATVHERFPTLSTALYPIPRDIPSLSTPALRSVSSHSNDTNKPAKVSNGLYRFGGRGSLEGEGGSGAARRHGQGGLGANGRGMLRIGSSRGEDMECTVLPAEATIFAVFIVGFCATIGVEPLSGRHGAGFIPNGATASSHHFPATPPPTPIDIEERPAGGSSAKVPAAAHLAGSVKGEGGLGPAVDTVARMPTAGVGIESPLLSSTAASLQVSTVHERSGDGASVTSVAAVPVTAFPPTPHLPATTTPLSSGAADSAVVSTLLVDEADTVNARATDAVITTTGGIPLAGTGGNQKDILHAARGRAAGGEMSAQATGNSPGSPPTLMRLTDAGPTGTSASGDAASLGASSVAADGGNLAAHEEGTSMLQTGSRSGADVAAATDSSAVISAADIGSITAAGIVPEEGGVVPALKPVEVVDPTRTAAAVRVESTKTATENVGKIAIDESMNPVAGIIVGNSLDSSTSTSPPSVDLGAQGTPSAGPIGDAAHAVKVAGRVLNAEASPGARDSEANRKSAGRLAFSELQHDVKEERLYKANEALAVAFEALEAMRQRAPAGEEAVYRSLISACGRCGNSEKAMAVVELMMSTGIVPDAMVSRCLVDAFAMDDSFMVGSAHPLALLDWSKFQPRNSDGRRAPESSGARIDTAFSFKKLMKRFEKSEIPTQPASAPATSTSPMAMPPTPASSSATGGNEDRSRPPSYSTFVASFSLAGSRGGSTEGNDGADIENFPGWHSRGRSSGTGRGESEGDRQRSANLRRRLERSASPYASRGGMSLAMQQQVLLGERMLECLFPELKIDNKGETCPRCTVSLDAEDVRAGWSSDPNNYTTRCRAWLDPRAAAAKADARIAASGWGGKTGGGGGASVGNGSSRTPKTSFVACGQRFVPRFSVHSTAAGWQGTTGPGTLLWCEYLSPWVLRKEFHTVLAAYGAQFLCSARFRDGLGPARDGLVRLGGFASGGGGVDISSGGEGSNARGVDRTIFWNLVVHFREHCLPITFLLADEAAAGTIASTALSQ